MATDTRRVRELLPLKHATFRPGKLGEDLLIRAENPSAAARWALQRYLWLVARAKRTLRLSPSEQQVVLTALRGFELNDTTMDLVWAKLEAEINAQSLAQLHGVDGPALVARVRAYSPLQATALIDAVEVFWHTGADATALERAGLAA